MFYYLAEIEFSFTVLGLLKDDRAIKILEAWIDIYLSWDDLYNINKAAMYGLATIDSKQANQALVKLTARSTGVVRDATQDVLDRW